MIGDVSGSGAVVLGAGREGTSALDQGMGSFHEFCIFRNEEANVFNIAKLPWKPWKDVIKNAEIVMRERRT